MPSPPLVFSLEGVVPEVVEFRTETFFLAQELENLDRVLRVGAYEAAIFYCARIQETLAAAALERVGAPASINLFSNLLFLENFALLVPPMRYWAHGLRRLGNETRHVRRFLNAADADLACLFTERWVEWYFLEFAFGPQIDRLTRREAGFRIGTDETLSQVLRLIDRADFDLRAVLRTADGPSLSHGALSPAIPALIGERLLDQDALDDATEFLQLALGRFPDDLRLRQLQGLCLSRRGELEEALAWLESLFSRFPDDEETVGILAGACKRLWWRDRHNEGALARAHRIYRKGWEKGRKESPYLGINAALTALFLEQNDQALHLASEVHALLSRRRERLMRSTTTHELAENYWDLATLAEAELLLGRDEEARRLFRRALARPGELDGRHKSTLMQLGEILQVQGRHQNPEAFLADGGTAF